MPRILCLTAFFLLFLFMAGPSTAQNNGFENWLADFKHDALQQGISQNTLDSAFNGVRPIQKVIDLDRKQPEGKMTFARYKSNVVTRDRIEKGRKLYRQHHTLLADIARDYGVPAEYIVALWGIETSFGENTGGFDVIPALATLAYDGRRSEFFRAELIKALRIIDQGHISEAAMKGSWAGAMGQNQFMPSSFFNFAVDRDGDEKRNIWSSLPDIFASTANYLHQSGWKNDELWGREVLLPDIFPETMAGLDKAKRLKSWENMGIRLPGGHMLPQAPGMEASLVLPDGKNGKAYLVYDNYKVIMKWNKSIYFATSVGLLADAIAGR